MLRSALGHLEAFFGLGHVLHVLFQHLANGCTGFTFPMSLGHHHQHLAFAAHGQGLALGSIVAGQQQASTQQQGEGGTVQAHPSWTPTLMRSPTFRPSCTAPPFRRFRSSTLTPG